MEAKSRRGDGPLQCRIQIGPHTIVSDAPRTIGGEETGPEPHDLLAAALAACTSLTVTLYARRKSMDKIQTRRGGEDHVAWLSAILPSMWSLLQVSFNHQPRGGAVVDRLFGRSSCHSQVAGN